MRPGPDPRGTPRLACRRALVAVALVAVAGLARAEAEGPATGGALTVTADPPQLVLGTDPGAELRVAAPAEVAEVAITTNVGRVDGVRRLPGGGFTARYHPPAERYPQVAVVAAVGKAGGAVLDGWVALPLAGRGDARVKGTPGAPVSLRIGDRTFGPALAGADGIAVVPVVVPPGVREAHQGFAAAELRVPETTLVHAALDRCTVLADRAETLKVLVWLVAPHGAARRGDAPVVEASRGSVTLRPREAGAFEGTWTLPPGAAGEERLVVKLDGFPASRSVLRVAAAPGPAASVVFAVDRPALVAGSVEEVGVIARALDAVGNPTPAPVALSADAGALTQEQISPGVTRATLRMEPRFGGRGQLVIRGRTLTTGVISEVVVPLQPGPAVTARFTPPRAYTRGDGRTDAGLTLELRDAWGNPAAGMPEVTASAGEAPRLELLKRGSWAVRWRGAEADPPAPVRLSAQAGAARARAQVWAVAPPRRQAAYLAGAGVLLPDSGGAAPSLLLGAELPVPQVLPLSAERALALRLELLGTARDRSVPGGRQAERSAALLAGPAIRGLLPPFRWFGSATGGLVLGSVDPPGHGTRAALAPALRLGLGATLPIGRTAPFLELSLLGAGHTPVGGLSALMLTFGVRLDTVRPPSAGNGE
jgi:hypothetical protein